MVVIHLLYLGAVAFFSESGAIRIRKDANQGGLTPLFYQGLIVQLANPKALMAQRCCRSSSTR